MLNQLRLLIPALLLVLVARADWARINIDGLDEDWTAVPELATDGGSDAFPDLLSIKAARDEWNLILRIGFDEELLLQQDNSLRLVLDTDANSSTGLSTQGLGAEIVWIFGSRSGTAYSAGGSGSSIQHEDIGLRQLPSHGSDFFEVALDLDAAPLGPPLFPGSTVRVVLYTSGGDRIPDSGHVEIGIGAGSLPALQVNGLARDPGDLRLLSWNTEFGGLFDGGVTAQYQRILRATVPDMIVFCEIWDEDANDVESRLDSIVPELGPWEAIKRDSGNIIASRLPIRQSWLVQSGYRETAVLIDASDVLGDSLLLIACHLRCCSANAERQDEADGLVEFIKDAREPAGRLALPAGTPILLAGDFNLVGDRQQLVTLLEGDIVDNGSYGPDSPPDWDGSPLVDVVPRHPATSDAFTWYDTGSSYPPGRLDFVLYTDSVIQERGSGVLWTPTLGDSLLAAWGLQAQDTPLASDHAPLWFDFSQTQAPGLVTPAVQLQTLPGPQLMLNWPLVEGAEHYRVEYRASLASGWFDLVTQTGTSFLFQQPVPGSKGFFRVVALNSTGQVLLTMRP